jgi:hypothetical protein
MKKIIPLLSLFILLIAIFLMVTPISAAHRLYDESGILIKHFSYFDMKAWGYISPFPFLTGVIAIISLALLSWDQLIKELNSTLKKVTIFFSITCTCASIYSVWILNYFESVTVTSVIIAILLLSTAILQLISYRIEMQKNSVD